MKKICLIAIALIAIVSGYNMSFLKDDVNLSDLAVSNIEALAGGESDGWSCPDSCKEWSGNSGGGIACDCNRYTGKCKNRC